MKEEPFNEIMKIENSNFMRILGQSSFESSAFETEPLVAIRI
jgi:hypothetical protein